MAIPLLFLLFISVPFSESKLTTDYYKTKCPDFERIVRETVLTKQQAVPTTAAGLLRMFFHDCFLDGCDASVLIASNAYNKAERDADVNLSLAGDAFDVITKIKTALELACPGVVSCADIEAQATRDLVRIVGGPFYDVPLGRKDSLVSRAAGVDVHLPRTNMTMNDAIAMFKDKGFNVQEMVALMGAHTIGFAHCKEFMDRINMDNGRAISMHPQFAERLRKLCANHTQDPTVSAFNDVRTPGKFDNIYYKNIMQGLGLLASDHAMGVDPKTRPFVELYANNQEAFFKDFGNAMKKLSKYGVKIGVQGEVRNRCDMFNNLKA